MTNTLLQSDMSNYLLSAISCLCILHTGVLAEECSQNVVGGRDTFYVSAGGSLSLSCVVQHCGDAYKGDWIWRNSTAERPVKESVRHHLTTKVLSDNETQMILNFLSANQSDEGFYGCSVQWRNNVTSEGHFMLVNVTAAVPPPRSLLHRILVCAGASLSLPIILGLARCLSSDVEPQPLPRTLSTHSVAHSNQPHPAPQPPPRRPIPQKRSTSPRKARPKPQQKTEVVYADISQNALRQQGATREPAQSTVYTSLRFS